VALTPRQGSRNSRSFRRIFLSGVRSIRRALIGGPVEKGRTGVSGLPISGCPVGRTLLAALQRGTREVSSTRPAGRATNHGPRFRPVLRHEHQALGSMECLKQNPRAMGMAS